MGYTSAVVPLPTKLSIGDDDSIKFVGAGVGKYHTILVGSNGLAYGSGGNLCGQLGINNMGSKGIDKFRKCVVMGQISGDDDEDGEGSAAGGNVKIVQVSLNRFCYYIFVDVVLHAPISYTNINVIHTHLHRHLVVRTSQHYYPPRDISTPLDQVSGVNWEMEKLVNTLFPLVSLAFRTVPNSCVGPSSSKANPIAMECGII